MKPCIYTGHYSEYKAPAAVCLPREVRGEETTGINYSREHISIYLLFNNVELAPDPSEAAHAKLPSEENGSLAESGGNQTESLGLNGMRVQI